LPFVDSDSAIEDAAGYSAAEIFERYGEQDFRDGERRLVARLIEGEVRVIATGQLGLHLCWLLYGVRAGGGCTGAPYRAPQGRGEEGFSLDTEACMHVPMHVLGSAGATYV
jgi:hypothetical protein